MNIQHRISNIEPRYFSKSIRWFRVLQYSLFNSPSIFTLSIILGIIPLTDLSAQTFQKIHSDLDNPTSISVTQNSIYIVEQGKDRLLKLDHSGNLLETIGGRGSGDYQFSKPVDVDATNGLKIFITDYNNRRVQVFDKRGQYLSSISGRNYFGVNRRYNPTQIALSTMGEVYFVDENARYIRHFDMDYNLLDEFRIPSEVEAINEMNVTSREILILDKSSETIHRLALNGSYQGFYVAEGVNDIYTDELGLWKFYTDSVEFESLSKQKKSIKLDAETDIVDFQVTNGVIYILTPSSLLRLYENR